MPDDLIMLGGPERRSRREASESIETLFHAHYAQVVSSTFARVRDWNLAELLAQGAYLRLWRRRRLMTDPPAALQYLQRTAAKTRQAVRYHDHRAGRRGTLGAEAGENGARVVDVRRAWRDFEELRVRSAARRRHALMVGGSAIIAALVILVPLLSGSHSARRMPPASVVVNASAPPRAYQRAIVASFELSGVISVAGDASQAWAVRAVSQAAAMEPAETNYELVAIDLRTNSVMYRVNLGRHARAIAAGAGRVWLTTPMDQAGGQIMRIDPASGRVAQRLHLRAGHCSQLTFSAGRLFAACSAWPAGTGLWMINPTGQASLLGGPVHGFVTSLVAARNAIWYVLNYWRFGGMTQLTGRPIAVAPRHLTALTPGMQDTAAGGGGLKSDARSVWALSSGERLYQIDALTGKVVRIFTYRDYDPARAGGLDYLTAGGGWLWFLDNGYPFSGVLRVSESTGRPAGGVRIPPGSCGQQACSQIFYTPGSVWVPTAELLVRIDTGRLPAG